MRPVARDLEHRLLRRVVAEVFDERYEATYSPDPRSQWVSRVRLSTMHGAQRREAGLRVSVYWLDATIFDVGVGALELIEGFDEAEKEQALRDLALVVRAYLRGEGRLEHQRGLFRTRPVLTVAVDGREWQLGRRWSKSPPPVAGP